MHLQKNFDRVVTPGKLPDTTVVVLGLMEMGYTDPKMIAEVLHRREVRSVRELLRMFKTSKNPVVRHCVDVGLPPGLVRPFPYEGVKVMCPICRCMVDHVPCPRCSVVSRHCDSSPATRRHPLPPSPTKAAPGTMRKVLVMRRRAAKGQSVFHPQDVDPGEECRK